MLTYKTRTVFILFLTASVCGCACRTADKSNFVMEAGPEVDVIERVLFEQARAWNRGDIDGFMRPYWHSPDLTFSSGGRVTRGWQATLERYRRRYPSQEAMGRLSFANLEVYRLGTDAALVLGRWSLQRNEPIGGAFSLVLRRFDHKHWVIVHDHTSSDPDPNREEH